MYPTKNIFKRTYCDVVFNIHVAITLIMSSNNTKVVT